MQQGLSRETIVCCEQEWPCPPAPRSPPLTHTAPRPPPAQRQPPPPFPLPLLLPQQARARCRCGLRGVRLPARRRRPAAPPLAAAACSSCTPEKELRFMSSACLVFLCTKKTWHRAGRSFSSQRQPFQDLCTSPSAQALTLQLTLREPLRDERQVPFLQPAQCACAAEASAAHARRMGGKHASQKRTRAADSPDARVAAHEDEAAGHDAAAEHARQLSTRGPRQRQPPALAAAARRHVSDALRPCTFCMHAPAASSGPRSSDSPLLS